MTRYRFSFPDDLAATDIAAALLLATVAVRGLRGEAAARLDLGRSVAVTGRGCVVDAGTPAGRDLARVFAALLACRFGDDGFRVERVRPAKARG